MVSSSNNPLVVDLQPDTEKFLGETYPSTGESLYPVTSSQAIAKQRTDAARKALKNLLFTKNLFISF
jgi:hypothetical protein